jgi:PAS domain S-box-containing protein
MSARPLGDDADRFSNTGELADDELRFRTLVNSIPQLAWMGDPVGAIFWFNDRWYEYTGMRRERGNGWGWIDVLHPDHVDRVVKRYQRCIASVEPWEDTFPVRSADGQYRWFLGRAVPLRERSGEVAGWLGTNTDVTEQQEIEEKRERLLIAERVARGEAERAREAAQAANKAKSEFLAMMSHELRTPLNGIVGYSQLLDVGIAGELQPTQREYLGRLRRSADHLLALVNDILDLAKIDARELSTDASEMRAATAIADALTIAAPSAGARETTLGEFVDADPPVCYVGDGDRVRQILVNLLSNAIKFSDPGGSVGIEASTVDEAVEGAQVGGGGPWTFIRVRDAGIGIAEEKHEAVFDPFVQAESGRTRSKGGTGLGLAISRRLARLMGGDLTLESEPEAGSTFTLWLPARDPQAETGESPEERSLRARQAMGAPTARTLAELGSVLRKELVDMLDIWEARLRSDQIFANLRTLETTQVHDHMLSFLGDVMQSLIIVERTGGLESDLLEDGTEIQRTLAVYHGRQRQRLGFTEEQLLREYALLTEVVVSRVKARGSHDPNDGDDTRLAVGVITRLLMHARAQALEAFLGAAAKPRHP